ncbi:lytic transglycosylase domain-containing protein [Paraburkholderia sp. SIMBA_009]
MLDFIAIAQQCAPAVAPQTLAAVAHVESSFNPYAIGVVGGKLERQPRNKAEAVATARELERLGYNFSLGAVQVNRYNLAKYGETYDTVFDLCRNLRAGAAILQDCYTRAKPIYRNDQKALRAAFSCYYSGNYVTGFRQGYVQKVVLAATDDPNAIPVVPAIDKSASPASPANASSGAVMLRARRLAPVERQAPAWAVQPVDGGSSAGKSGGLKYEASPEGEGDKTPAD